MMRDSVVITGTDTGVGKTLVSAVLTLALNAYYWKPVQSGLADEISEEKKVQQCTGLSATRCLPSIYSFQASLSPDQAANLENEEIDISRCALPVDKKPLIIEGAGGVCVPLNEKKLLIDLMQQWQLPVIIVARGTLGTINHTLLTIEALRHRDFSIQGVVFSGELNVRNQQAIEKWGEVQTLFHLPFFKEVTPVILKNWIKEHL